MAAMTPLVSDLWPNHGDYAHLCRIDNHDLIIHLGELVGLRFPPNNKQGARAPFAFPSCTPRAATCGFSTN
jgi:hypothetical protein